MKRILVVDDETAILTLLKYNLEQEHYQVSTATDGTTAYDLAVKQDYDFIILDLMLPGLDGIEVTKKLRQQQVKTPIMILTAKDSEVDKIIGLEIGADDYVTKPFSPREIMARIKAIFRRTEVSEIKPEKNTEPAEQVGNIKLDLANFSAFKGNERIELTPKEFELLAFFIQQKGQTLQRETLLNAVWGYNYDGGETRMVDIQVSHLRDKIEDNPKKPIYLKTIRGFGYKMEEPNNA